MFFSCVKLERDVPCLPANVCSWGNSGRAADIAAMTGFDPTETLVGIEIPQRNSLLRC
jgi:hypothetical protein